MNVLYWYHHSIICSSILFIVQLVFIFVEPLFEYKLRVFRGTIPWSSTINLLLPSISVFVSVYCHRPRAQQPTLCRGGLKPATTKLVPNVGPMAGDRGIATSASRGSACHRLTAKSYKKLFLSARNSDHMTLPQWPIG